MSNQLHVYQTAFYSIPLLQFTKNEKQKLLNVFQLWPELTYQAQAYSNFMHVLLKHTMGAWP